MYMHVPTKLCHHWNNMILWNDMTGFAGGLYYAHTGAAAEYLYLSPNPVFTTLPVVVRYAFMYGAEYDSNAFGHDNGDDIPCAVCHSRSATSSIMIPGTNSCVSGGGLSIKVTWQQAPITSQWPQSIYVWTRRRKLLLMVTPDNINGKLVQPVKAVCGALECPPYHDGKILTCAVCTKKLKQSNFMYNEYENISDKKYNKVYCRS